VFATDVEGGAVMKRRRSAWRLRNGRMKAGGPSCAPKPFLLIARSPVSQNAV
jgi:hypothetical protein